MMQKHSLGDFHVPTNVSRTMIALPFHRKLSECLKIPKTSQNSSFSKFRQPEQKRMNQEGGGAGGGGEEREEGGE